MPKTANTFRERLLFFAEDPEFQKTLTMLFLGWVTLLIIALLQFKLINWKVLRRKGTKYERELPGVTSLFSLIRYYLPRCGLPNYVALEEAREIFGSVFQLKIGNQRTVAVMDMNLAKQIMSAAECMNRLPPEHVIYERSFNKPLGLLFGNDEYWVAVREFAIRTLHNLGFGKGIAMESCIMFEVQETLEKLDKLIRQPEYEYCCGSESSLSSLSSSQAEVTASKNNIYCKQGIFQPHGFFHVPTLNILWHLIAGSRFSHDDPQLAELLKYFYKWNRSFNLGATPLHIFPWLRHIPHATEQDAWVKGHHIFLQFFRGIMEERLQSKKYLDSPNDFIDYFLLEIKMSENDKTKSNYFTEEQLLITSIDLFMAGADTTSNSLEFAILFMMLNPDVQIKVQEEIDAVVGRDRMPCLLFKKRMPFTEATTMEILRHGCAIPVSGRCPLKDMQINGCPVPKGTIIAINIHGIHFNKDQWSDPHAFRPQRFLSSEGNIINAHKIMPFGHGKRKCLGEATSRNAFFLFFTSLLQKYSFSHSPLHSAPNLKNICGLSRAPQPYFVMVKSRE